MIIKKFNFFVGLCFLFSGFLCGCANNKKIYLDPANPVYKLKNDFENNYGFFITQNERKKGYPANYCKSFTESVMPFDLINSVDEFNKFEKCFWELRDVDPVTSRNEFKELIDKRIEDIKGEVFSKDLDIPLTGFDTNGGLKGDLAHVYLFYGPPNYKEKMPEGRYNSDLMVWYYFDQTGKPLFRFLFYNKLGGRGYTLFKNYVSFINYDTLFDPVLSPLKDISNRPVPTSEDLFYLWEDLSRLDPAWVFRSAIFEFSYYIDVKLSDALKAPDPLILNSEIVKVNILGSSKEPKFSGLFESKYHSFIPAHLRTTADFNNPTFLMIVVMNRDLDWFKQGEFYIAQMNLRISFQNKKTRKTIEFLTFFEKRLTTEEFNKKDEEGDIFGSMVVFPILLRHWDGQKFSNTLKDILDKSEAGDYIVNVYLEHGLTKKYNSWLTEIVIKK
jgi:GWxTD domain-containing protein